MQELGSRFVVTSTSDMMWVGSISAIDDLLTTGQLADHATMALGGSGLRIRCPHCRNPFEIVVDGIMVDVTCEACGCVFSLMGEESQTRSATPITSLGHFELIEQLGVGGFATVWKARDTELDRTVAVKIPRQGQLSREQLDQFLREARAAAQLHHPNIVAVHEVGRQDGTVFIVSNLVRGVTLSDWITACRPTPREAASLCAKITDAVHFAHEAGIIHRDLKPQNILIDRQNEPHVMDFGLAKREAVEITMTIDGQILGTPAYMSPEQAQGEAHRTDRRTDVYALGVILFELLTGELPFRGNARMLIHQVIHHEAPSPCKIYSIVPRDLETICMKCLEKEPFRRYQTAEQLSDELQRFLSGEPIRARPIGRIAQTWRWGKRNPVVAGLTVFASAILVCGIVASSYFALQATDRAKQARLNSYAANVNLAYREWEEGQVGRALARIEALRPKQTGESDLRGFEWDYIRRLCATDLFTLTGHTGYVSSVALSLNGKWIASADQSLNGPGLLKIWNATNGSDVFSANSHAGGVWSLEFSPDGQFLVTGGMESNKMGELTIWDLNTGRAVHNILGHDDIILSVAYSPDGKWIASGSNDQVIKVWEAASGDELLSLKGHASWVNDLDFGPGGQRLASCSSDQTSRVWSTTTGEQLLKLHGHTEAVFAVRFSPDGRLLATGSLDCTARTWNAEDGTEIHTFRGHEERITDVLFDPDQTHLVTSSDDQTVKIWDLKGENLRTLRGHAGPIHCISISPEDRRLVTGSSDKTVKMWDPWTNQEVRNFRGHTRRGKVWSVAFRPDGKQLASGGGEPDNPGELMIWDIATGEKLFALGGHADVVRCVEYSPDGNRLVSTAGEEGRWGELAVWDANTAQRAFKRKDHADVIMSAAFSPNGTRLVTGSLDGKVKIRNANTGDVQFAVEHGQPVQCVTVSPDGKWFASGGDDDAVRVWNMKTGQPYRTLLGHRGDVTCLTFSPDSAHLATGGWDALVRLWNMRTGKELLSFGGHRNRVCSVVFSPDGKRLVSLDRDAVRVWDVTIGRELLKLKANNWCLAFSPQGGQLCSGGYRGTLQIWDSRPLTDELKLQYQASSFFSYLVTKHVFKPTVVQHIRMDTTITEPVRQIALSMSARYREDPYTLNERSWSVVRQPNRSVADYHDAKRWIEKACQLEPDSGHFLNTLGVAEYRVGDYRKALETLEASAKRNTSVSQFAHAIDLAFIAMSYYLLGHDERAIATLNRLKKMELSELRENRNDAYQAITEAQSLIAPVAPVAPASSATDNPGKG